MTTFLKRLIHLEFSLAFWGKKVRFLFRENVAYPILFGPLRGISLYYDPEMTLHSLFGLTDLRAFRYLKALTEVFHTRFQKSSAVDLGANRGLYALWFAKTGAFEKVYAFEPHPHVHEQLEKNISHNEMRTVEAVNLACADKEGVMDFILDGSDHVSALAISGTDHSATTRHISVATTSLDNFFFSAPLGKVAPGFIKMDIEGAGTLAIPGFQRCLKQYRPFLYVESHSPDEDSAIASILKTHEYEAFRLADDEWVTDFNSVYPTPGGVWGNLFLVPKEFRSLAEQVLN